LKVLKEIETTERSESQILEIKRRNKIDGFLDQAKEAFKRGETDLTIEIYGKILKQDPENVLAWLNMGNVFKGMKRFSEAEIAYKRTLEINPFYLYGNIALAQLYLASKVPEKALDVLRSVRVWHSDSEVSLYMGLAFAFQKKIDLALKEFQNAILIDPEFSLPYYYIGVQYFSTRPNFSEKNLKKFLVLSSSNGENQNLVLKARQLLDKF